MDVDFNQFRTVGCLEPLIVNHQVVRCGKCVLCRVSQRKEWSLRLDLEALSHEWNSFHTLTYDQSFVPFELQKNDLRIFIQNLRRELDYKVRYFACGEYGEKSKRPHFHIVFFGLNFSDFDLVQKMWKFGFSSNSLLSSNRSKYVCGYVQKKLHFFDIPDDVKVVLNKTSFLERCSMFPNEPLQNIRVPEFSTMSLKPGLGYDFLMKNFDLMSRKFYFYLHGVKYLVPRYFRKVIADIDPTFKDRFSDYLTKAFNDRVNGFLDEFPGSDCFDFFDSVRSSTRLKASMLQAKDDAYRLKKQIGGV